MWDAFLDTSRAQSHTAAIVSGGRSVTFGQLRDAVDGLACNLSQRGTSEGRITAVVLPNDARFAVAVLALMRLGAVPALVPVKLGRNEWESILSEMQSIDVVMQPEQAMSFGVETNQWLSLSTPVGDLVHGRCGHGSQPRFGGEAALVKLTSGSTAMPKGIALSRANLGAEVDNIARTLQLGSGNRILAPVPISHSYGFDLGVLPMVYLGTTLLLEEAFLPHKLLRMLTQGDIDVFLGVPAIYHFLLEAAGSEPGDLSCVHHLLSCTAPLGEMVIRDFHAHFGAVICQHYGSSETGAVANHVAAEVLERPASVGRALQGVEVEILDEAGGVAPDGTEGEIAVRSAAVALGYIMGAPSGRSPFRGARYHMGDFGVKDSRGFIEVRGRVDDIINVGGYKVTPQEVLQALECFPAVREAFVYGEEDEVGGQRVVAIVTLRSPTNESDIISHCHSRLADFKVPRRVHIVDEMPRGPTGKVKISRHGKPR